MTHTHAIDTHAHLWTEEYLKALGGLGATGTAIAAGIGVGTTQEELDKRLAMMDKAGVDFQVLSATPQVPQFGTAEEVLALAQDINNTYKDIIKRYPDRFRAYGVVPLPHIEEAIQEGKRIIEELGF
ncbi:MULTISPECIES: amidohydrolase family protein [unclassified Streptococcus]|uniref:amidohydrolase family protein n=1 Tax=unclassified Streptococcus TaxID=2608887 RepID=UPI00069E43A1|nr:MULTISPECIES: amidohydrolase family protein [unclassified Streptococcus]